MFSAFKDIRGEKKPCLYRKNHPSSIAVSITEDALKGFSNDFLSIIWIFKSQCPYSNSPGSKTSQQKGTQHRSDGKGRGKIIEKRYWAEKKRSETAICMNTDRSPV